ncbi:hypothetical protein QGP82_34130 [Leptothoe sp. LEGE 181152]|nr:hypothetical protein [Leptothoe sp. LEGE 181152]
MINAALLYPVVVALATSKRQLRQYGIELDFSMFVNGFTDNACNRYSSILSIDHQWKRFLWRLEVVAMDSPGSVRIDSDSIDHDAESRIQAAVASFVDGG